MDLASSTMASAYSLLCFKVQSVMGFSWFRVLLTIKISQKNSQSVARLGYVTKSLFYRKIADQLTKGALVGVSWANVSNIRALRADVKLNKGVAKVRAICVLDRVDEGDVEGHATMGFAEGTTRNVNQGQIGTIRMKIRLDLANAFSSIVPTDSQPWPWAFLMPLKRIASIVRELFALVRLK